MIISHKSITIIQEQSSFKAVVAIDFGTTYSGYAYALTKEPEKVHIMRKWEGMLKDNINHIGSRNTKAVFFRYLDKNLCTID